jgi:hypothetical protein
VLVSLWSMAASAADCPEPLAIARLSGLLEEAEDAFAELDIDTFIARSDTIRASLPCLAAVPPPALVARVHRTEGLRLFGERNVDAVRAFAASRSLDPEYVFSSELVPPGSPIRSDFTAMDLSTGEPTALPEPAAGRLYVDGRETRERLLAWPALVQLVPEGGGSPLWSAYLPHEQPPPSYEAAPPPPVPVLEPEPSLILPAPLPEPVVPPPPRARRVPLLVATGASALVAGVTYGAAWSTHSVWADPETADERLEALRAQTNALGGISVVAGLATVGLGATLALTW